MNNLDAQIPVEYAEARPFRARNKLYYRFLH